MSDKFYNPVYTRRFEPYVQFIPTLQSTYADWERATRFYQKAIAQKRFRDARDQMQLIRQAENKSMELHAMLGGNI